MSMIDVGKQVDFWREGSVEDWVVARELVRKRRVRHGLFFAYLALEKLLKALVVQNTGELAPRVHSLLRLAIDVSVVSPRFDAMRNRKDIGLLWRVAARTDSRLEPIACGERQWREDRASPIVEVARREGQIIAA